MVVVAVVLGFVVAVVAVVVVVVLGFVVAAAAAASGKWSLDGLGSDVVAGKWSLDLIRMVAVAVAELLISNALFDLFVL